jgi:hypothetical protein
MDQRNAKASILSSRSTFLPPHLQPLLFVVVIVDRLGRTSTPSHQLVETTLIPSYRRSLAFPLYCSWTLAESCRKAEHSTVGITSCFKKSAKFCFSSCRAANAGRASPVMPFVCHPRLQGTQMSFVLPSAKCRLSPISPHFGRLASDFCVASAISNFARRRCFRVSSRLDLFSEPKFRISSLKSQSSTTNSSSPTTVFKPRR